MAAGGAASASQPTDFLKNAPSKFYAIQGTIPAGSGGLQLVTWQQSQPPIIPAYLKAIHLNVQMNVALIAAAIATTSHISEYAPYSMFNTQLTLGGAPPWPPMELTPWHLDNIACRINYDDAYFGLGLTNSNLAASNTANFFNYLVDNGLAGWVDTIGQAVPLTGGAATGNISPGTNLNNAAAAVTTNFHCTFNLTIRLQRRRHLLWGAVPFGDPENRPNFIMQLNTLIGTQPEQCFISNVVGGPYTSCLTTGTTTVTAIYELLYIDLLPQGVQLPEPVVGFGLQVVPSTTANLAQNVFAQTTHRTAMAMTAFHHILVNGQVPTQSNYFGLWDDQDPQSARWQFDTNLNQFHRYFTQFLEEKRRLPILGWYLADQENGKFPEIPSVTPLDSIISPDATYAAAFGVPVTPAITTVVRLPVAVSGSCYVRTYDFGLVKVPY